MRGRGGREREGDSVRLFPNKKTLSFFRFEAVSAGAKRPQRAKRATRAKQGMLGAKRRGP